MSFNKFALEVKQSLRLYFKLITGAANVVSLNPVHGKVYSIQHYVIKFVSDL